MALARIMAIVMTWILFTLTWQFMEFVQCIGNPFGRAKRAPVQCVMVSCMLDGDL